jgi:long-chain acyl-CoA synthetase
MDALPTLWQSSPASGDRALNVEEDSTDILGRRAAEFAERPAVTMGRSGAAVTYGDMGRRSGQLARFFRSLGLERGDVVAILMENNLEFLQVAWAAQRSGLYYAAVNWHLSTDEVAYILQDCGAQVLITSLQLADMVADLSEYDSAVRAVLCVDGELPQSTHSWKETFAFDDAPLTDGSEGCELLYSSGTTGRPKAVKRPLPPPGEMVPNHKGALASYTGTYRTSADSVYL